ncbi:MAG: hypothetical protein AB1918_15455, partial [Pseudomonadota bacterium]
PEPDLHMKDIEVLLRGFAMLMAGDIYSPSMTRFLNMFSKRCSRLQEQDVAILEAIFKEFVNGVAAADPGAFMSTSNQRFNISTFDAVMAAVCADNFASKSCAAVTLDKNRIESLKSDPDFQKASQSRTSSKANVQMRLKKAQQYLK